MEEVLEQVKGVVDAQQGETKAQLAAYRQATEDARASLHALRTTVEEEGAQLASLQRQAAALTTTTPGTGGDVQRHFDALLPPSTALPTLLLTAGQTGEAVLDQLYQQLLSRASHQVEGLSEDVLRALLSVEDGDDVPAVVRGAIQRSLEMVVADLTSVLAEYVHCCADELHIALQERDDAQRQLRAMSKRSDLRVPTDTLARHDAQRAREGDTVEKQLRAHREANAGTAQEQNTATARTLERYRRELAKSRDETSAAQQALEEERRAHRLECMRLREHFARGRSPRKTPAPSLTPSPPRRRRQASPSLTDPSPPARREAEVAPADRLADAPSTTEASLQYAEEVLSYANATTPSRLQRQTRPPPPRSSLRRRRYGTLPAATDVLDRETDSYSRWDEEEEKTMREEKRESDKEMWRREPPSASFATTHARFPEAAGGETNYVAARHSQSARSRSAGAGHRQDEPSTEAEVWAKTVELLTKFGRY